MPGDSKRLPLPRGCDVPLYSLKLSIYDPEIIDALERLRKSRKQATFIHEAIKQFLSTERGKQVLANMEGGTPGLQLHALPSIGVVTTVDKPPDEPISAKSDFGLSPTDDCSDILTSILN